MVLLLFVCCTDAPAMRGLAAVSMQWGSREEEDNTVGKQQSNGGNTWVQRTWNTAKTNKRKKKREN